MKPNFALNLSHDGLSLLRRAKAGWQVIGRVALDDAEMSTKLGYLRKTAAELAGGQLASKLVIPNSEILYHTIQALGENDADREKAVARALEGCTPYAVDDLVFDWADAGDGMALVAAVARDTLDEAESFAVEHRFNPVSFVAIPDEGDFVGEPDFGLTGLSASILPNGESIENDPGPIVIVGDHDPDTGPQPPDLDLTEASVEDIADAVLALSELGQDSPTNEMSDQAAQAGQHDGFGEFSTNRDDLADTDETSPDLHHVKPRFALYPDKHETPADAHPPADKTAPPQITPMPVTSPDVVSEDAQVPPDTDELAKTEQPEPPVAAEAQSTSAPRPAKSDRLVARPPNRKPTGTLSAFDKATRDTGSPKKLLVGLSFGFGLAAAVLLAVVMASVFFDRPFSSSRLWSGFSGSDVRLAPESLTAPQIVATTIEPLARPDQSQTDGAGQATEAAVAVSPIGQQTAALVSDHLSAEDRQTLGESELAESEPLQPLLGEITRQEAIVIEASTGVWVLAPVPPVELDPEQLDDFYVASIDPVVVGHDPVVLPDHSGARIDFRLSEFHSPAPAGTVFDLDERGFVRATRDGAISPDGVRVFLGSPAVRPILRQFSTVTTEIVADAAKLPTKIRPTLRPANLKETNERAQLGGLTRLELSAIRPITRPPSPQDASPNIDLTPTDLAVVSSVRPTMRSGNFASVVANARAAQTAAAVVETAAVVAVPKVPTIPTTASVAREATIVNAINLSQVNLIGVYGSSGTRRALVRLKNGRYVKVQIGDRLDGGKVAAIEGDKLQYIKGGRMLTLDIAS